MLKRGSYFCLNILGVNPNSDRKYVRYWKLYITIFAIIFFFIISINGCIQSSNSVQFLSTAMAFTSTLSVNLKTNSALISHFKNLLQTIQKIVYFIRNANNINNLCARANESIKQLSDKSDLIILEKWAKIARYETYTFVFLGRK